MSRRVHFVINSLFVALCFQSHALSSLTELPAHKHPHTHDPVIKLSEYLKTCVLVFLDGGRIKVRAK